MIHLRLSRFERSTPDDAVLGCCDTGNIPVPPSSSSLSFGTRDLFPYLVNPDGTHDGDVAKRYSIELGGKPYGGRHVGGIGRWRWSVTRENRRHLAAAPSAALIIVVLAANFVAPVPRAGASSNARVITGVVDVNTNLGYENAAAEGTGMLLSASGEVLTNNHVIRGATTIKVRDVHNGKNYNATVVGYDVAADVAVIQMKSASELTTVPLGDSATVKVGAKVTGIGNAEGAGGTPSSASGKVLALDQSITASDELAGTSEQLTGLIEMSAAVEPGDSGGPLVNASGLVVGMITAGSDGFQFPAGASEGYAIPIGTANSVAQSIESGDFSTAIHPAATAFLGVDVRNSGYFRSGSYFAGVIIVDVVPSSPAEKAGLVQGDVITSMNSTNITSTSELGNLLLNLVPNAKVSLHWISYAGIAHQTTIKLASGPPQ